MTCGICGRKTFKQFIREDIILCYECKNIYDKEKNKNINNV
jgi:hypothetical protein